MAKRKTRAVNHSSARIIEADYRDIVLSSGIKVRVSAFPMWLHRKIERRINDEFEIPDPPLKSVKTVDGEETVENPNDPDYVEEIALIERARKNRMAEVIGEAVCDLAVKILTDEAEVEEIIKTRLEKYVGPFPEDPNERRTEFLFSYAATTTDDYEALVTTSTSLMVKTQATSKEEVDKEIDAFPGDLEGDQTPEADTSGAAEG